MAGRHAAVVPRSRSRSPQAVARTDPGEMISQVRGVSGTSVASIEMHTHDRCRVLKRRISSVPQRTCVQERTTKRVMVSSAPCGIMLHVVVIHASSIRVLACVNMAWLHSVRTVIRELRRGFLDGDFNVGCLAPEVLHDGQAKMRLQRILCMRYGNRVLDEDVVWWFRTQLYLQYAVGKSKMSFQDLLHRCYFFRLTEGTTSTYLKASIATVLCLKNLWKDPWDLNSSMTHDLSTRETWVASIWVDPYVKCCRP